MANYNIDAIYNGSTSLPGTERVRIDGAGNIGIGASTPLTRLFVSGSSSTNENLGTIYVRQRFTGTIGYGLSISRDGSDTAALSLGADSSFNAIIASNNSDLRIGKNVASTFNEYVRINTNGNVGIGVSTINYRLEVYNSGAENVAKFRGTNDSTIIIGGSDAGGSGEQYITYQNITTNTQAWMVGMDDGEDFRFAYGNVGEITDGNTLVKIGQNGNVGIGTTNPIATLDIENSVANVPVLNLGGGVAANNVSDLYVLNSYNTGGGVGFAAKVIGINISGSLTAGNIPIQRTVWSGVTSATAIVLSSDDPGGGDQDNAFQIWTSNNGVAGTELTQKFSLTAGGNVGIGTTGPATKLEVYGVVRVSESSSGGILQLTAGASAIDIASTFYGGSRRPITFTMDSEKIRIDTSGNLLIGTTTSPSHDGISLGSTGVVRQLLGGMVNTSWRIRERDVIDAVAITTNINDAGTQDSSARSSWKLRMGWGNGQDNLVIARSPAGSNSFSDLFYVKSDGNVGIGTTSPIAKLQVSGSTMMMGDAGTFRPRQTIVGNVTGAASTTYKKIFACGHTSTGIINVTAIITSVSTASATATFSFATAYGNPTVSRMVYVSLNSTITSIDCQYNNTGYQMEIAVTYTGGTAPTLYFTAEGLGSQNWAY